MGNSEVGHNALGAGKVYDQGAVLVGRAINMRRCLRARLRRLNSHPAPAITVPIGSLCPSLCSELESVGWLTLVAHPGTNDFSSHEPPLRSPLRKAASTSLSSNGVEGEIRGRNSGAEPARASATSPRRSNRPRSSSTVEIDLIGDHEQGRGRFGFRSTHHPGSPLALRTTIIAASFRTAARAISRTLASTQLTSLERPQLRCATLANPDRPTLPRPHGCPLSRLKLRATTR